METDHLDIILKVVLLFLQDPEGKPKKANIRDNHDGTYLVSYVPDMTGRYTILIKYGGDEIPYSPYRIRALPTGDASKCTVTGKTQRCFPLLLLDFYKLSVLLSESVLLSFTLHVEGQTIIFALSHILLILFCIYADIYESLFLAAFTRYFITELLVVSVFLKSQL